MFHVFSHAADPGSDLRSLTLARAAILSMGHAHIAFLILRSHVKSAATTPVDDNDSAPPTRGKDMLILAVQVLSTVGAAFSMYGLFLAMSMPDGVIDANLGHTSTDWSVTPGSCLYRCLRSYPVAMIPECFGDHELDAKNASCQFSDSYSYAG